MEDSELGRIASRAVGILLLAVGMVALIDFFVHLQSAKVALSRAGWTNYRPLEVPSGGGPIDSVLHDVYYQITPTISPLASGLFGALGLLFLICSRSMGRLIAGSRKSE